ncbi:MAG: UDP-N-acetylglucosamine--N-acetylmuramyl-(pentapeptide) pyrophosphoryl-undecaprenol N-acetylglucosamine transferase [Microthrixaceae bacterium]
MAAFAGSLGSRRINEAVAGLTEAWRDRGDLHVYHVVGRRDWASFRRPEVDDTAIGYQPVEYEEHMDQLLAAADVAVCRSGGTTVAELAVVGLPSILVPLPIAPGDHQRHNARALVDVGSAVLLDDADCTTDGLAAVLGPLVDEPARLDAMARDAWTIGRPHAAADAADLLLAQMAGAR